MDLLDNTLEEFIELFQGSTTYFGVSKPTGKKNSKGKAEFKHWVEPSPMTKDHWVQHLKGEAYYGSVPIRDDNTCSWGVIGEGSTQCLNSALPLELSLIHI